MISPFDAWAVKRALVGHGSTDTLPGVPRMLRPVVEHLRTLPSAEARGIAWQALLCIRPFREQLVRAVDDADPGGSPPEGPRMAAELIRQWKALGGSKGTLLNARDTMQTDGRLSVRGSQRLQTWLKAQGKPPAPDAAVEGSEGGDRGRESADAQNHQQF